jgi:GH18 family chitinase
MAPGVASIKIDALDLAIIDPLVDAYFAMTYDFTAGGWGDAYTGHHTQTLPNPADPLKYRVNIKDQLNYFVKSGASASKVILGVAFYGRGFLFTPGTQPAPFVVGTGTIPVGTWEPNGFDYSDILKTYYNGNNIYYDAVA